MKFKNLFATLLGISWILISIVLPFVNVRFFFQYLLFLPLILLAVFLHVLIAKKQFKRLVVFLVFGWILPALPTVLGRLLNRGRQIDRLAYLPISYFVLYILLPEIVLAVCFLLSHWLVKSSTKKATIVAVLLFSLLPLTLWNYSRMVVKRMEQRLCDMSEITRGLSNFVYFVNPITREEFLQILTTYDLRVDSMVVGVKDSNKSFNQIGPMFRPALGAVDFREPLLDILNKDRWPLSDSDRAFIEMYEKNEPVIWGIKIEDSLLSKVLPFFLEYDQRQHRLGIWINQATGKPTFTGHNMPINDIQPKRSGDTLMIERCYPNI